jgi:hypothetical protein
VKRAGGLDHPRVVHAADAHAKKPNGQVSGREPLAKQFVGCLPQLVGNVRGLGQGVESGDQREVSKPTVL